MDDGKVLPFDRREGAIALSAGKPSQAAIEVLEDALERARSGDIQAIVLAACDKDSQSLYWIAGHIGSYSLIGAAQVAVTELIQQTVLIEED